MHHHIATTHSVTKNIIFVMMFFLLDFLEISDLVKEFKPRLDQLRSSDDDGQRAKQGETFDVEIKKEVDKEKKTQGSDDDDCIVLDDGETHKEVDVMASMETLTAACQAQTEGNLQECAAVVKENVEVSHCIVLDDGETHMEVDVMASVETLTAACQAQTEGNLQKCAAVKKENVEVSHSPLRSSVKPENVLEENTLEEDGSIRVSSHDDPDQSLNDTDDLELIQQMIWPGEDEEVEEENSTDLSVTSFRVKNEIDENASEISCNNETGDRELDLSTEFEGENSLLEQVTKILSEDTEKSEEKSEEEPGTQLSYVKLSCDICSEAFINKELLKRHREEHRDREDSRVKENVCKLCSCKFTFSASLNNHVKKIHHDETEFLNKELTNEDLKSICFECGRKFVSENCKIYHKVKTHFAEKGSQCWFCQKTFKGSQGIFLHYWKRHKKDIEDEEKKNQFESFVEVKIQSEPVENLDNVMKENFEDAIEDASKVTEDGFLEVPPKLSLPSISPSFTLLYSESPEDILESRKAKFLQEEVNSEKEKETVKEERIFRCSFESCSMEFSAKKAYNHHKIRHLLKVESFCKFCNKRFEWKHSLKLHLKKCHNDEKDFLDGVVFTQKKEAKKALKISKS